MCITRFQSVDIEAVPYHGGMRVISGRFKGFSFDAPKTGTRPTTDRVKEALFSHLESEGVLGDARVLDLFAGTGALSFEALSRGARSAVMVDMGSQAVGLLKRAAARCRELAAWSSDLSISVRRGKAESVVARLSSTDDYSLVFLDPPYDYSDENFNQILKNLCKSGALSTDACIVAERSSRSVEPIPAEGWEVEQTRGYGETVLTYFVREPE